MKFPQTMILRDSVVECGGKPWRDTAGACRLTFFWPQGVRHRTC